jgi:hypothetical protein
VGVPPPPPPDVTDTVTGHEIVVVPFEALKVYVVSDAGETVTEPLRVVAVIPLLNERDVTPVVDQVIVVLLPRRMLVGDAVSETLLAQVKVGTGGGTLTVTVVVQVTVPPLPVAVSVYVVVTSGDTVNEPSTATAPIALSIVTDVAFVVFQVRVLLAPRLIVVGLAVNDSQIGASGVGVTVTVVAQVADTPALLVTVMV